MKTFCTRREGAALVIVLALVVLLTGLVMAFFSQAMSNRQLSNSSFNQVKVDELARSALDIIVADLKQEMVNGSAITPNPNPNNFPPTYTPSQPKYIAPQRGIPAAYPNPMPTLLRTSTESALPFPAVDHSASASASNEPSANGRSISTKAWNKHYLLPRPTGSSDDDTTPVSDFNAVVPKWVFVTSQGPATLTTPPAVGAPQVIGRYAYAIYDTSGLLDVNVAGYPSNLPVSEQRPTPIPPNKGAMFGTGNKGAITFADLKELLPATLSANDRRDRIDNLVGWRSYASAHPSGEFPNLSFQATGAADAVGFFDNVLSNTSGNLSVSTSQWNNRTDQAFLSRRQLIAFALSGGVSPEALQHLTTFSRAVTTPAWKPEKNSADLPNHHSTLGGTDVNYADDADSPASANRNLSKVRFPASGTVVHYNDQGERESYTVQEGDPLFKQRFSLAKLAWLGTGGPSAEAFAPSLSPADRNAAILACFGLQWDNSNWRWNYVTLPASNVHIYNLHEIADQKREPNFFELLNAGILSGSLGRDPGRKNTITAGGVTPVKGVVGVLGDFNDPEDNPLGYNYKSEPYLQILQIGANIIDQADTDNYPTAIYGRFFGMSGADELALETAYGIENLPYLARIAAISAAYPIPTGPADTNGLLHFWLQPELWNPHQQPGPNAETAPTELRVRAYGSARGFRGLDNTNTLVWGTAVDYDVDAQARYVYFTDKNPSGAPYFANNPKLLGLDTGVNTTNTWSQNQFETKYAGLTDDKGKTNRFAGLYAGRIENYVPVAGPGHIYPKFVTPNPTLWFSLEYRRADGNWSPYNFIARIARNANNAKLLECQGTGIGGALHWKPDGGSGNRAIGRVDPRTDRFSLCKMWTRDWSPECSMHTGPGGMVGNNQEAWPTESLGKKFFYYETALDPPNNQYRTRFMSQWAVNNPAYPRTYGPYGWGRAHYADRDGVVRYGDCYRANITEARFSQLDPPEPNRPATGDGCQLYHAGSTTSTAVIRRPIILNRPFRSVGELGFVYRDQPFKTLDFWSSTSADMALLELFSTVEEPVVVAGRINPNGATKPVLQAIFSGALKNSDSNSAQVNPAVASTLADILHADINDPSQAPPNGPYSNRADLAARVGERIHAKLFPYQTPANPLATSDWLNKAHGESPMRALSSVTNVRTWNLLVDVVAQSGSFKPHAQNLNSFVVQGECRYWMHIAIDRLTGRIIDQKLEPVYE